MGSPFLWPGSGTSTAMFEYKVVGVRQKKTSGTMSAAMLQAVLNEHAAEGWQLRALTSADMKGMAGKTEGVLLTFERPRQT